MRHQDIKSFPWLEAPLVCHGLLLTLHAGKSGDCSVAASFFLKTKNQIF